MKEGSKFTSVGNSIKSMISIVISTVSAQWHKQKLFLTPYVTTEVKKKHKQTKIADHN